MKRFSALLFLSFFLALALAGSSQDSLSAVGSWIGDRGQQLVVNADGSTVFQGRTFPSTWVSEPTHLRLSRKTTIDMVVQGPNDLTATIQDPKGSRVMVFSRN